MLDSLHECPAVLRKHKFQTKANARKTGKGPGISAMRTVILKEAYDRLLEKIKEVDREIKQNSKDIARAADFGDLSENAEYDAAKERQAELLHTLSYLESYLKARIIEDRDINTDVVSFGTAIKLFDMENNKVTAYTLAGPLEYDLEIYPNIMTFTSPLGQGLIGKKKGEITEIELPRSKSKYLVVNIESVSSEKQHDPSLVIIGHMGHDVIHVGDENKGRFPAGSAYQAGVGASACCDAVALVTRISKNDNELIEAAKEINCRMDGVKTVDNGSSPEFNVRYGAQGQFRPEKTIEFSLGSGADISHDDFPAEYYSAGHIHIASAPPEQQLAWVSALRDNKDIDAEISVDISGSYLKDQQDALMKILPQCDIIFASESERELFKDFDIEDKVLILKKSDGSSELWIDGDLQVEEKPLDIEPVDPGSYGGVLAGAFMAMLSLKHDDETAFTVANRLASKSVRDYGVAHLLHPESEPETEEE